MARADVDHPQPADVADEVEQDLVPDVSVVLERLLEIRPRDLLVVGQIPEPLILLVRGQELNDAFFDRVGGSAARALDASRRCSERREALWADAEIDDLVGDGSRAQLRIHSAG